MKDLVTILKAALEFFHQKKKSYHLDFPKVYYLFIDFKFHHLK